jgi:hypothetical protein
LKFLEACCLAHNCRTISKRSNLKQNPALNRDAN